MQSSLNLRYFSAKFIIALLSFYSLAVNATDYYVSKLGSDANAGTSIAAPFLTIGKALSSSAATTIYILERVRMRNR